MVNTMMSFIQSSVNDSFIFFSFSDSAVVMDHDELSKDDLIGGTQISLYEVLTSLTHEICIKRLLDDRSVSRIFNFTANISVM